ncbi:hypothetical protein [Streptomyces sp. NPDC127190]|uniref:YncE family protein n=1 Tax=unclassified Streptomyces TaxID=2593676 RepID=UPI00363D9941
MVLSDSALATIPVGQGPKGVAVSPDGLHLYVANHDSRSISVVDTMAGAVETVIPLDHNPWGIAITPDGRHAYVSLTPDRVGVLDLLTHDVITSISVPGFPAGVALTPNGERAYAALSLGESLSIIDTASNTLTGHTESMEGAPIAVAITRDGRHAYVPTDGSCLIEIVETETGTVSSDPPIVVGCAATDVTFTPDGRYAFSLSDTLDEAAELYVIDVATKKAGHPVIVGNSSFGVAVAPDMRTTYITAPDSGSVLVVLTADILKSAAPH